LKRLIGGFWRIKIILENKIFINHDVHDEQDSKSVNVFGLSCASSPSWLSRFSTLMFSSGGSMIVPVILSGGAGTRLWPLSRELYPKQLLPLVGERTMLQETVLRLEGLADLGAPLVVCNDAHRFMVAEQLRQVEQAADTVILEPVGRNTAPAVAVAALQTMADGDDPLLLVLAADHVIRDAAALCTVVTNGVDAVQNGALLTFGIVPTAPETGYGYIRRGARRAGRDEKPVPSLRP
jgi:mannose-1-phosphate guanylyltransferase/mannose-6-phosphate isomerase